MPYTPVPAVSAGDWIDEVFINTYWVDNMAASVPDVFSAKGQIAVGLGVDSMGILNVGADNKVLIADATQSLGMKWGDAATMFTTLADITGFTGGAKNTGTYNLTVSDISQAVPSSAKAIFVTIMAQWASITGAPSVLVEPSVGQNAVVADGLVANILVHSQGIVPLNAGAFVIRVLAQNAAILDVNVAGYIL